LELEEREGYVRFKAARTAELRNSKIKYKEKERTWKQKERKES
jgi:hypothetical protein